MSKSIKVAIGVVAVALAYSGASWYVGKKLENEIGQHISAFNDYAKTQLATSDDAIAQLSLTHFERGVFSSNVNYELIVGPKEDPIQLLINDKLQHGPFPLGAVLTGHLTPALAFSNAELEKNAYVEKWFQATKGINPLQIESVISFDGALRSVARFAEVSFEEEGTLFNSAHSTIDLHYLPASQQIAVKGLLPSLSIEDLHEKSRFAMGALHFDGSVTGFELLQGLHSSTGRLQVDSLFLDTPTSGESEVRNVTIDSFSEVKEGLLAGTANYSVEAILINAKNIGSMALNIDMKRLDYALLNQLAQKSNDDAISDEELTSLLQRIAQKRPELAVTNFSWKNAGGESAVSAAVEVAPTAFDKHENAEPELGLYVDRLNLSVILSRAMLRDVLGNDSMMAAFADMAFDRIATEVQDVGLLNYNGIDASATLSFDAKTKKLSINNKEITPEELLGMIAALEMLSDTLF